MANVDTIDITKLLLVEQSSTPSTPSAGKQKLYIRTSDHKACLVDSSGAVTSLGASLTDPTTTRGDIIVRDASALARLAIGAAGKVLKSDGTDPGWGYAPFHGCSAYLNGTTTLSSGVAAYIALDTEDYDSDAFHFTSAANLTGTVAKTATSAAIVGTGTSFTTELAVNQVIAIPGTATEIGVVQSITDNTHLTLWQTMANTASGQTAVRRNDCMAIPSGMGGKYRVTVGSYVQLGTVSGVTAVCAWDIFLNGALKRRTSYANLGASSAFNEECSWPLPLVAGDYLQMVQVQNTGSNATAGFAATDYTFSRMALELIGV